MIVSWMYFLGNNENPTEKFLYGLSLHTKFDKNINLSPSEIGKVTTGIYASKKVFLFKSVNAFTTQDVIEGNKIKMQKINSNLTDDLEFNFCENVLQHPAHFEFIIPESPISTTIALSSYYTKSIDSWIKNDTEKPAILEILRILEKNSNQKFTKGYSRRLGCYEIALNLPPWAENKLPFDLRIRNGELKFEREDATKNISLHLIVFKNGETIFDEHIFIPKKQATHLIPLADLDDFKYWIFSEDGKLLHHEHHALIKSIQGSINILGDTVKIAGGGTSISTTCITPSHLETHAPRTNEDIDLSYKIQLMGSIVSSDKTKTNQKFFIKSDDILIKVINYINSFLGDELTDIYFIDPFISKISLLPICGINKTNVKIKIISAWKDFDPDEDNASKKELNDLIKDTLEAIDKISQTELPAARLQWFNLKAETIHDRFIYIKNATAYKIFSISNSLNNLLGRYNISVFEFNPLEKIEAQKYLEEIILKINDVNQIYPKNEK